MTSFLQDGTFCLSVCPPDCMTGRYCSLAPSADAPGVQQQCGFFCLFCFRFVLFFYISLLQLIGNKVSFPYSNRAASQRGITCPKLLARIKISLRRPRLLIMLDIVFVCLSVVALCHASHLSAADRKTSGRFRIYEDIPVLNQSVRTRLHKPETFVRRYKVSIVCRLIFHTQISIT